MFSLHHPTLLGHEEEEHDDAKEKVGRDYFGFKNIWVPFVTDGVCAPLEES
jgi:hypothetical protein